MNRDIADVIRQHCREMTPLPTSTVERLTPLPGIRAVLFDIYGTLVISGAGDMTLQTETSDDDAFRAALIASGLTEDSVASLSVERLKQTIARHHEASRENGIEFPEVNIVEVWADVLEEIQPVASQGGFPQPAVDLNQLAAEYEFRANPVWPMPGAQQLLAELQNRGLRLGIVSNAQAMTLELFPVLFGQSLDELGFDRELQFYSYQFGESKPGRQMFDAAVSALAAAGIRPEQAVFVGNDRLKDVWAASQVGMQTILFAGDARSLRWRDDDPQLQHCRPDAVITRLHSVADCLSPV